MSTSLNKGGTAVDTHQGAKRPPNLKQIGRKLAMAAQFSSAMQKTSQVPQSSLANTLARLKRERLMRQHAPNEGIEDSSGKYVIFFS